MCRHVMYRLLGSYASFARDLQGNTRCAGMTLHMTQHRPCHELGVGNFISTIMSANIFSVSTVVEGNTLLRYLHMFGQHDH